MARTSVAAIGTSGARRSAALGVLGIGLATGLAAPAAGEWRRIDSPNFVVIGDRSTRQLRDVAIRFEGFREALGRLFGERLIATAVPTVVVVFPSDRAFTPFKPVFEGRTVDAAGLFMPGRDVNYIAFHANSLEERLRVVFHEYAHLIVSNTGRVIPTWLGEGLAEYYSTFALSRSGREAELGRVVRSHLYELQYRTMLPLEILLEVDGDSSLYNEGDRRSVFYAQSWALTHLMLSGDENRKATLLAYLDRLSQGAEPVAAWQEAFGAFDIERELQGYIRRNSFQVYQFTFSDRLASFDRTAAPMEPGEADALLADLLAQQGRLDDAAAWIEAAEGATDNVPLAIAAARLDVKGDEPDRAFEKLRDLGAPDDWLFSYLAGAATVELADGLPGLVSPQVLETARRFFASAKAGEWEFPNAAVRVASLEVRSEAGPTEAAREAVERAFGSAPGRYDYVLLYAQILARQSRFAASRAVLEALGSGPRPPGVREEAERVLAVVIGMEAAASAAADSSPPMATSGAPLSAPARSAGRTEEPTSPPLFRQLKDGEVRVEGVLDRIECTPERGVVFHLRTVGRVESFSSRRLDDVEFISYRDDLEGSIGCDRLSEPLPVYLTWRPADDESAARAVVAIEFLPRQ